MLRCLRCLGFKIFIANMYTVSVVTVKPLNFEKERRRRRTINKHLFAFTYLGQQYTYTRLPQGYVESPTLSNRVLAHDLQHLKVRTTVIQYADDLLICSHTKSQCEEDSVSVLSALAKGGHKIS